MLLPWLFKDINFGVVLLGILFSVMNIGISFSKLPLGYVFDKVNPKPIFSLACFVMLVAPILTAYIKDFYSAALFLALWAIGYSILSLYVPSFYSLSIGDRKVGRSWGFFNALLYFGYFLGPFSAALLLNAGLSPQAITSLYGLPFMPSIFLALLLGHPKKRESANREDSPISVKDISKTFYKVWIWTLVVSLAWGSLAYYIPLITDQLSIDRAIVSLLYTVTSVLAVVISLVAGEITDRFGLVPTLVLGQIMGLGEVVFLLTATDLTLVSVAFICGGLYVMTDTAVNTFITKCSTDRTRGRSFGLFGAFSGLGWIIGPLLGAALWSIYSLQVLLLAGSVFLIIGLALGYISMRK
jgi:MFS family permease